MYERRLHQHMTVRVEELKSGQELITAFNYQFLFRPLGGRLLHGDLMPDQYLLQWDLYLLTSLHANFSGHAASQRDNISSCSEGKFRIRS